MIILTSKDTFFLKLKSWNWFFGLQYPLGNLLCPKGQHSFRRLVSVVMTWEETYCSQLSLSQLHSQVPCFKFSHSLLYFFLINRSASLHRVLLSSPMTYKGTITLFCTFETKSKPQGKGFWFVQERCRHRGGYIQHHILWKG